VEFDYANVHAVWALQEEGYEVIMVNSNPETVSTDYDTADRLYFEPLTVEDVLGIVQHENPVGVVVGFGGQTPLKLSRALVDGGIPLMGIDFAAIELAEDREQFGALLEELELKSPPSGMSLYCRGGSCLSRLPRPDRSFPGGGPGAGCRRTLRW